MVSGSATGSSRALTHLLQNAFKFTQPRTERNPRPEAARRERQLPELFGGATAWITREERTSEVTANMKSDRLLPIWTFNLGRSSRTGWDGQRFPSSRPAVDLRSL